MKYGLVLEGGSRKGLYTSGILDIFIQNGIRFDYVIGVSAGAQAAINFVTEQYGRSKLVFTPESLREERHKKGLVIWDGVRRQLTNMVYKFSFDRNMPFNFETFFSSPTECEICATCMETGKPVYFSGNRDPRMGNASSGRRNRRLLDYVCASSSFPILFPSKEIDGLHYLDGCVSDSIPFSHAFEKGCDKIVVISTKESWNYPTNFKDMELVLSPLYKKNYPLLFEAMENRYENYYRTEGEMNVLEKLGKIYLFRPEQELCDIFESDPQKIERTYAYGLECGRIHLEELKNFMSEH